MKDVLPIATGLVAMTPADVIRSASAVSVLGIVSYRVRDGIGERAFLQAAEDTEAIFRNLVGTLARRYRVRDANALWTHVVEWRSVEAALSATREVIQPPEITPFDAVIDGDTVERRHAPIRRRLD